MDIESNIELSFSFYILTSASCDKSEIFCSINLVPIMSLRFLFWRKAKIGRFWNTLARFEFTCRRCQCFITVCFILGSVLLYLSNKGIVVTVSFFFSFKSCTLSCKLALSICCSINDLLYPRFWNWSKTHSQVWGNF